MDLTSEDWHDLNLYLNEVAEHRRRLLRMRHVSPEEQMLWERDLRRIQTLRDKVLALVMETRQG